MTDYKLHIDLKNNFSPLDYINEVISFFLRAIKSKFDEDDFIDEKNFVGDRYFSSPLELNEVMKHEKNYLSLMKTCGVEYVLEKAPSEALRNLERSVN